MSDIGLGAGIVAFVLLTLVGWLLLSWCQSSKADRTFQLQLFMCAFTIRFLVSILLYQFGLVSLIKDEDGSIWVLGMTIQESWQQDGLGFFGILHDIGGVFTNAVGRHRGYYYILAAWFSILGSPSRLAAAVLNGWVGALTVVLVYRVAVMVFSKWVAVRVAWIVCLFPSLILWSAQTLKEPMVIFLETLVIYSSMRLRHVGFTTRHIVFSVVPVVMLIPLRFYAAYITGFTVVLSLLIPRFRARRTTFGSAVLVIGLIVAMVGGAGLQAQREVVAERFNLEHLEQFRAGVIRTSNSNVKLDYDLHTPHGLLATLAVGGIHLLLAPFPWQWQGASLRLLLTVPESVVWWWLCIAGLVPGVYYIGRKHLGDVQPLFLFLLGMGLPYSLAFSNLGLAFRQRAQLLPWLLIFALVGLEQRRLKRVGAVDSVMPDDSSQSQLGQPGELTVGPAFSRLPISHSRVVPWR